MKETKRSLFPWAKEIDISPELYRVYRFPNGEEVRIDRPLKLTVSDNGHRLVDSNFIAHYIPYGWIHLWWENVDKEKYQFFFQRQRDQGV